MENAGEILGGIKKEIAASKIKARTKSKLTYQFKDANAEHQTKNTGNPLVVLKGTEGAGNPTLFLKSRHDRGVKAAQSRKLREELIAKYKDVMTKPYKIGSEKTFKGKNRFNPF